MLSLEMSEIYLSATNSKGNLVSQLWGDGDSTQLTAGTRSLYLRGKDVSVNADSKLYFPGLPPSSMLFLLAATGKSATSRHHEKASSSKNPSNPRWSHSRTDCFLWTRKHGSIEAVPK